MHRLLACLSFVSVVGPSLACATEPQGDEVDAAETGEEFVPCEQRTQAACSGLAGPDPQFSPSCNWFSLIPLTDVGNSCAMGSPIGQCMAVTPVNDGCGGPPELECTLGDTTAYGTGAVTEIDGQVYLLDGAYDCYPPGTMTGCTDPDTEAGCECACDLILGG